MFAGLRQLSSQAHSYALATLFNIGFDVKACVVATAAEGTPMQNQIGFLKTYREKQLVRYSFGVALLKLYFLLSIPLARLISHNAQLMRFAQFALDPTLRILQLALGIGRQSSAPV
jgi:hypothetical protein